MKFNTKTVRLFTDKHLENFGSIFETLYKDELLTDCTLCCKEGSIQVHKLILAASSPYFRNFFLQHGREKAIFFMYGISFAQLKNFIELIYKGSINVPPDNFTALYDLAEELQVTGLLVDGLPTSTPVSDAKFNGCGVDTRFKGQKRVVVDFNAENESSAAKIAKSAERLSTSSEKSSKNREDIDNSEIKDSETSENTSESSDDANTNQDRDEGVKITTGVDNTTSEDKSNLSAWARKERKFKCELCPSSFKRASHLSRHQLVHTGERPYACHQCDKAFSRHDKLKHHIHKAHELQSLNECLPEDSLYTIGHIQFLPPEQSMFESPAAFIPPEEPDDKVELSKVSQDDPDSAPIKKKARGRPRKYPIVPPPVSKRPRGRPRLKPFVPPPLVKRPRGRPRLNPIAASQPTRDTQSREIYDITNMPYGDLQYLTKPTEDKEDNINEISSEERQIMEPLVEINMDLQEKSLSTKDEKRNTTFLKNIGLFEKAIGSSQTSQESRSEERYDITNMPYGDFQYLTKPVEDGEDAINEISLDEPQIMEPLVEIKMEPQEKSPLMKDDKRNTSFLENIGLFEKAIGKIGECTISVASNSNNDNNPSN